MHARDSSDNQESGENYSTSISITRIIGACPLLSWKRLRNVRVPATSEYRISNVPCLESPAGADIRSFKFSSSPVLLNTTQRLARRQYLKIRSAGELSGAEVEGPERDLTLAASR
jgi:hypothetical protein